MKIRVKIEGIHNILGRGWILSARDERLSFRDVLCGTTIAAGGRTFTVSGVERAWYGDKWYSPMVGIRLSPNDQVDGCFHEGQEIDIETEEV